MKESGFDCEGCMETSSNGDNHLSILGTINSIQSIIIDEDILTL